jgi:hypothetical protein
MLTPSSTDLRRRIIRLLGALAALTVLVSVAHAVKPAPARAFQTDCEEGNVVCEAGGGGGDGGDIGDNSDNSDNGGVDDNGSNDTSGGVTSRGSDSPVDPCASDYTSPDCWGTEGAGGSTSTNPGGSPGVDSNDPCADWGVSCGTGQQGTSGSPDQGNDPANPTNDPNQGQPAATPPQPSPPAGKCQSYFDAWMNVIPQNPKPGEFSAEETSALDALRRCEEDRPKSVPVLAQSDRPGPLAHHRGRHRRVAKG